MGVRSWVKELVIDVIEDERAQAAAMALGAKLVTQLVLPVLPVAIGAAIDKAFDRITDLDQDGKPDIAEVVDSARDSIDKLLPPGINLPVIGDLGEFIGGFFPNLNRPQP